MQNPAKRSSVHFSGRRAFTLMEILLSITVISLLAIIFLIASREAREAGNKAICANNMRQIYQAEMGAVNDNGGVFFSVNYNTPGYSALYNGYYANWPSYLVLNGFLPTWDVFRCPSAPKTGWPDPIGFYVHYACNEYLAPPVLGPGGTQLPGSAPPSWSWGRMVNVKSPTTIIMLIDGAYPDGVNPTSGNYAFADATQIAQSRHNNRVNVVYLDGHVESTVNTGPPTVFDQNRPFYIGHIARYP